MIIRILGEGRSDVSDEALDRLDELDSAVESAVESGDEAAFAAALAACSTASHGRRAHALDSLDESDLILPPADATIDEVRRLLNDDGSFPAEVAESQRQPVPREDGGEAATLRASLAFARASLLRSSTGSTRSRSAAGWCPRTPRCSVSFSTAPTASGTGSTTSSRATAPEHGITFDFVVPPERTKDEVVAAYLAAAEASDAIIAAVGDFDAPTAYARADGLPKSLRWVVAHKTSELARHAGHADILRELIDGTTGR